MIERPLYQNPLAGGQKVLVPNPSAVTPRGGAENELQGDALVNSIMIQMQQQNIKSPAFNAYAKDVIETRGYPTKTMQEYRIEFPSTIGTLLPLSEQTPMSGLPEAPKAIRTPGLPSYSTEVGTQDIETIASVNPFQEQFTGFQNQLTDFGDQFSTLGDRLTKLEEGIASLLNRNMSSNFNSMQPAFGHSRYGYSPFSMVGLGSLFGGYYG